MLRSAAVGAIAAATCVLLPASPAGATTDPLPHGNDWARTYYQNDDIISVHDGENDGHIVWADYYLSDGSLHRVTDATGPNNGGFTHDWTQTPYWITGFRVCESDGGGCTGWRHTD
jgi:hypothetical protein